MPAITRKTKTTPTASPDTAAAPGGWLTDEVRVHLSLAGIPVQLLDTHDSPWWVPDELRPTYAPAGPTTNAHLNIVTQPWAQTPPKPDTRGRTPSAAETRHLADQARRLGWPDDLPAATHYAHGRLGGATWAAWTAHARLMAEAQQQAARRAASAARRARQEQKQRKIRTCQVCGEVDPSTDRRNLVADLAPERDPGTRFYAPRGARNGQQIQACQPCVDAIRLQRAQAKQDAARAWLTAHPDPLPSRW